MKNFKVGDKVIVITGQDKGREGKILRIDREKERVMVEGIALKTKAVKNDGMNPGGLEKKEAFIHISNIMHVDPKTKKRTRIKFETDKTGKKQRVSTKSGEKIA